MKHLIVSEIALLSEVERRARREMFHPTRTVVLGTNDTGKSSLLKAIYYTFGAEPAKQHERWKAAGVKTLIKFSVDGDSFQLLRDDSYFALFSGANTFLKSFTRVTGDLGPHLANLFDFGLILPSRQEEPETPPPAFLFLPFYMDQDASWQNTWSAFDRLFQFSAWKEPLVEYHSGIRNNEYYKLRAQIISLESRLNELTRQERSVITVAEKLRQDSTTATFNLDPTAFSDQIRRLLQEGEVLLDKENALKGSLTKLNNERLLQQTRLAIAERALGELAGDFKFLTNGTSEEIECPTCGNRYENDFAVRFSIANDEDRVAEFIAHIRAEIARLDREIEELFREYSLTQEQAESIQKILNERQGELSLKVVIESEGRRAADNLLTEQRRGITDERTRISDELQVVKRKLKDVDAGAQGTRRLVMDEYERYMRRNFGDLAVQSYSDQIFKTLNPYLHETGSTLPRAILGYQFAVLDLIAKRTPATVCPIVVDSPNQQAQDRESLVKILTFISTNQPENTQLILGLEDTMGVEFGGKLIETKDKYKLLNQEEYQSVHDELSGLLKASLNP